MYLDPEEATKSGPRISSYRRLSPGVVRVSDERGHRDATLLE